MIIQLAPISKVLVFLINVIGISLILTVLIEDIKPVIRKIFILMNILVFVWVDLAFLARLVGQTDLALLFIRIAWSITPLLFVLVYSFIINILEKSKQYKILTVTSYITGVIFLLLTLFTHLIIADTLFENNILQIMYGQLIWLFFGIIAMHTLINFYLLIKYYKNKKTPKETKFKLKFLLAGLSIFFIANATFNIIFPVFFSIFHLYEFGDYTTVIFMILIAYAIVKHRFFDIKILGASFVVSFLASFLLLDTLIFSDTGIQRVTKGFIFLLYIPFGILLLRSVIREVKHRKRLQELTKKLKDMDKQKDEFINMAAHELRAPMTAIKGYISMVVGGDAGKITDKARSFLGDANTINERVIRLINNMLNVSRIEEGRMVYQMEVENLSQVVRAVFSGFRAEAEKRGLKFSLIIPREIKDKVEVDPDRIHEVLANFLSNAVKYTDKGSVEVRLSQPNGSTVRLEVIDTGPGISKEEQTKLFKKFSRAESSIGKTTGTGLGLYICKLLVEKFKGEIGLESEVGKGSIFWFELPLAKTND